MRSLLVSLVVLAFAASGALGMTRLKRGDSSWDRKKMEFLKGFAEGEHKGRHRMCKDPTKMISMMFSMMCNAENCAENTPMCMKAVAPPGDMCEFIKECKKKPHDEELQDFDDEDNFEDYDSSSESESYEHQSRRRYGPQDKKKMMSCVMEKSMESVGLVYIPDDYSANTLALLDYTVNVSQNLTEVTKRDMMSAVSENVCVLPTDMIKMKENMQFMICLMKTCVTSMAPQ